MPLEQKVDWLGMTKLISNNVIFRVLVVYLAWIFFFFKKSLFKNEIYVNQDNTS